MASRKKEDSYEEFEKAAKEARDDKTKYVLRLFVTGVTPKSTRAIQNIKAICEEYLKGRYELEIIDVYQQPELGKQAQILAAPTLLRELPLPLRKLVGDLSQTEKVLVGLDLTKKKEK